MKNKILKLFSIPMLITLAIPAYANSVLQVWPCELLEGKTDADVVAVSAAWFNAAKGMQGGEHLALHLNFPEVADVESGHFLFVLVAPSFAEWGAFTAGYANSPAAKADEDWNKVAKCSGNSLWNSVSIE